MLIGFNAIHQDVGQLRVGVRPNVNDLVVALVVGDETHVVVLHHFSHLLCRTIDQLFLLTWDDNVVQVERQATFEGHVEAQVLDVIQELRRTWYVGAIQNVRDDATQRLLRQELIDVARFQRHVVIEQYAATRGLDDVDVSVDINVTHFDLSVQVELAFLVRNAHLFGGVAGHALALHRLVLGALADFGHVVQAQHHVL